MSASATSLAGGDVLRGNGPRSPRARRRRPTWRKRRRAHDLPPGPPRPSELAGALAVRVLTRAPGTGSFFEVRTTLFRGRPAAASVTSFATARRPQPVSRRGSRRPSGSRRSRARSRSRRLSSPSARRRSGRIKRRHGPNQPKQGRQQVYFLALILGPSV